jgi:hypothetical protein
MSDEGFISRWSRRKSASKGSSDAGREASTANPVPAQAGISALQPAAEVMPAPAEPGASSPAAAPDETAPLPPVESLTPDSDFAAFMKPEVDADTRRAAVKMLFRDPRYNLMDGLDVYIDDYSKPDPLPEGWLEKMTQTARLGEYREPEPQAAEENIAQAPRAGDEPSASAQAGPAAAGAQRDAAADTDSGGPSPVEVKQLPARE